MDDQDDQETPGPVRRHAGDYLGTEFLVESLGPLPGAFAGAGLLLGAALDSRAVVVGFACLLASLLWWLLRSRHRRNLLKGGVAERQIGRALEQAVTADSCAVAHNVEGGRPLGDIDHIVATPQGVWVVETKYRRVPKRNFPKVLNRISANVARVLDLLPPDTPVTGCLVLAYESNGVVAERDGIRIYNHDTFRSGFLVTLREERRGDFVVDRQVTDAVWRLGRGDVEDDHAPEPGNGEPARSNLGWKPNRAGLDEIRRRFPKAYERWSVEDDRELRRLSEEGWNNTRLGEHFGRKPSAIKSRLDKLGQG